MPCNPIIVGNISVPASGGDSGFGKNIVPPDLPFDLPQPIDSLEDLSELYNKFIMILPFGTVIQPHLTYGVDKNPFDAIKDFLKWINIFLIPLKFIIPILQMILCIIEVLCALLNPFKLARALRKLFRTCIPALLSLFPQAALILVIIALLILIIELIIYLIQRIIALVEQIVRNIEALYNAIHNFNDDSVIAIVQKIGDFLCVLQNFFVIFGVIAAIFEVIQQLIQLFFKLPPCKKGDEDGCCDALTCPAFVADREGFTSNTGTLLYFNKVVRIPIDGTPNTVLRQPSFQLTDAMAIQLNQFNNITHAYDLPVGTEKVFFPENMNYTANSNPASLPYTVDLRFYYNPADFNRTDPKGGRMVEVKNCVILSKPQDGVNTFNNGLTGPYNGTLFIGGGKTYEDGTEKELVINDKHAATLEELIYLTDKSQINPELINDGFRVFTNLTYNFKINHEILIGSNLITLGCSPQVRFDIDAISNTLIRQTNDVSDKIGKYTMPNIGAAQDCLSRAIEKFRGNISPESAKTMQEELLDCLNNLGDQTKDALTNVIDAGFSSYSSDFTIDPGIQFTTLPINVSVALNEAAGTSMTANLPIEVASELAEKITAKISFGKITPFAYDGASRFTASLTSETAGNGDISVAYDNQFISILTNSNDIDQLPTVDIKKLNYTFVYSNINNGNDGAVRRDEGDIARE